MAGGYCFSLETVEITIKNQIVTDPSKQYFFSVRLKDDYGEDWVVVEQWAKMAWEPYVYLLTPYPEQDYSSQYTVLRFQTESLKGSVDFQVQALVGTDSRQSIGDSSETKHYATQIFTGEAGDWSPTQTLIINQGVNATATPCTLPLESEASSTSTPADSLLSPPTSTPIQGVTPPTQFNFDSQQIAIIAFVVAAAVSLIVVAVFLAKRNVYPPPPPK